MAVNLAQSLENWCEDHDGDLTDFFGEGSIYGETEEGDYIVGFGVCGNANLLVGRNCVKCGNARSPQFSTELKKALAEFRSMLENC
jgi:hypothetical protein